MEKETRKQFEDRLLRQLLKDLGEPLCNVLMFAGAYLEKSDRPYDKENVKRINKCVDEMAKRVGEILE